MGGKTRIAKQLAEVIDQYRQPGQLVWDAFCGGLSMSVALSKKGPVLASDAHPALISLYLAVKNGWDPPKIITEEEYRRAKNLSDTDPLKAFCGFGCSYSGKYFGGYAKCTRPDRALGYAAGTRKVLLRDVCTVGSFACIDFLNEVPRSTEMLIYCDPPYCGTTRYSVSFNHAKFVERVIQWSKFTSVFISEYDFPVGQVIFEKQQVTTVSRDKDRYTKATEKLFYIAKGSL
jgi:DNA adenine methylase